MIHSSNGQSKSKHIKRPKFHVKQGNSNRCGILAVAYLLKMAYPKSRFLAWRDVGNVLMTDQHSHWYKNTRKHGSSQYFSCNEIIEDVRRFANHSKTIISKGAGSGASKHHCEDDVLPAPKRGTPYVPKHYYSWILKVPFCTLGDERLVSKFLKRRPIAFYYGGHTYTTFAIRPDGRYACLDNTTNTSKFKHSTIVKSIYWWNVMCIGACSH